MWRGWRELHGEVNKDDLVPLPEREGATAEAKSLLVQLMHEHKKCEGKDCPKCEEIKRLFISQYDVEALRKMRDSD
jgi:hypothetical protein